MRPIRLLTEAVGRLGTPTTPYGKAATSENLVDFCEKAKWDAHGPRLSRLIFENDDSPRKYEQSRDLSRDESNADVDFCEAQENEVLMHPVQKSQ